MTAVTSHVTSDIDYRTERDCVTRGRIAALNRGNIRPRWVDVMPPAIARDLLAEVRAAREDAERYTRQAQAAASAAREYLTPEHVRVLQRARGRAYYQRTKAAAGDPDARRAAREAEKAATRTPDQQQRHDYYVARKRRKS